MRVWHLISNRWNSAISEYALSAARALRSKGAQTLVTALQGSPIESRFSTLEFELESVDQFGPSRFPKLYGIASKFNPDIIFTYGGPETTAALFLKNNRKLVRFYGQRIDNRGPVRAWTNKIGHLHVDQVIAPSQFVAGPLKDVVNCPVGIVSLGCDPQAFYCADISRANRPELLIFGRLDPVKGHREFLIIFKEIVAMAKEAGTPVPRLRIIGMPANISPQHLWAEVEKIGLSRDDVEIRCEKVADVASLMSACTLGIISSIGSEVICRVAEEFLLCGTPVATTDVGSLPELFFDQGFGACFDRTNPREAAAIISKLVYASHAEALVDRQKRAASALNFFSLDRMSTDLLAMIQDAR